MMLIFGLMLLQTAACLELNCSFNQKDSCYAALGHKLSLLMVNTSEYDLRIKKRIHNSPADPVCRVKNDKMREKECDLLKNRTEVTVSNGTLIINGVIREDSGNYNLNVERSNGTITSADLQVNVEAPIGSVEVSISCSSNGVKSVSCSSDGDQLIYSWTLNGESLMDGNATIQLNEETDGNIICSVKNHVSDGQKSISVKRCPGSTTAAVTSTQTPQTSENVLSVLLIVLACVSLTLILLFFTACHIYKRKQLQSTPVPAGGTELVYAQISHDKHPKSENKSESQPAADAEYAAVRLQTSKKEKKKEEVQYGEVTFTQNHSNALHDPKEDCVYSQVQRH